MLTDWPFVLINNRFTVHKVWTAKGEREFFSRTGVCCVGAHVFAALWAGRAKLS